MSDKKSEDGFAKISKVLDKAKKKHSIAQIIVAATGLGIASVLGMMSLYDSFFPRYERPDYEVVPGVRCYANMLNAPQREEFSFQAGDVVLKGYFYPSQNSKGTVVLVHGFHAGADDYLPVVRYLVQNNFSVFAYDGRGTYDSSGDSTVGFCQSLVDLDNTLTYIEKSNKFGSSKLFLFGHSCGGYAVTSVLELHKNISACAAIAPVNNCYTLIVDKGKQYVGQLASTGLSSTFLNAYQAALFGKYTKCNGVRGINSVDIPVLIAHGVDDKVISFKEQSVIAYRDFITNPNVDYYVGTGLSGGHDTIWHSARAVEYQKKVADDLAELKKNNDELSHEQLVQFYSGVDDELYSEINYDLMAEVLKIYNSALK